MKIYRVMYIYNGLRETTFLQVKDDIIQDIPYLGSPLKEFINKNISTVMLEMPNLLSVKEIQYDK